MILLSELCINSYSPCTHCRARNSTPPTHFLEAFYKIHESLASGARLAHLMRTVVSLGIPPLHTGTSPSPGYQNILHAQPLHSLTFHLRARNPCLSHYPKGAPGWRKQRPGSDLTPDLFHTIPIKGPAASEVCY